MSAPDHKAGRRVRSGRGLSPSRAQAPGEGLAVSAYYNEIDPSAAAWLRELIAQGHIAPGEVDERSIVDVRPDDLAGFAQCHFFAGIGVWSYALRNAGWPDDRSVWTGSCPCQPFSAAGKGDGFADERHLWPAFHHLIRECRPDVVFGEQVASKDGLGWLDLVQADLEGAGYASGAVDTCAAGFGAPHIRQRLYWMAHADDAGLEGRRQPGRERADQRAVGPHGMACRLADADSGERHRIADGEGRLGDGPAAGRVEGDGEPERGRATGGLAEPGGERREWRQGAEGGADAYRANAGRAEGVGGASELHETRNGPCRPGPTNGLWRDADWLLCRDGKWRPVEPGTFPLAHGAPARVGRLRGYGNAINAAQATAFVEAAIDALRTVRAAA